MHPSALFVVFDRIFDQIRQGKRQLRLIHFGIDRAETLQHKVDILLVRDRCQSLDDQLQQFIDIFIFNMQICCLFIHLHKRQKIRDDLILTIDLFCDIRHKLLIKLHRCIRLCQKRICKYFHRCDRCFQLV